jgi:mannose-6-phosphate isomerase
MITLPPETLTLNTPLRFRPYLRPMVWGGRRLGEALHKPLPTAEPYGESWEVSDHPSHSSLVADGPLAGRTLRDLMEQDRATLLGPGASARTFPWLVKYLDANDWLSVQVHPDDDTVRRWWPGEDGKTEAWFILDAAPGSKVYAGLLPGVDEKRLRAALDAGTVADCLHQFTPRPGDCLFLKAGTVHAVGGGVLIAEVQQTSDATFRLFDWNRRDARGRSRELHVEQSIACIDWNARPVRPVHVEGYPDRAARRRLVECRYFTLDYLSGDEPLESDSIGAGRLQVAMVVHGRGVLQASGGNCPLGAGDTLVLPAAMSGRRFHPDGKLGVVVATLPDMILVLRTHDDQ